MKKRVLMAATVPSMIGHFNMNNIAILQEMGFDVDVACDYTDESVWPAKKTKDLREKLEARGVNCIQIDFSRSPSDVKRHIESYKELKRIISDRQYKFIHTHTPIASAIIRIAAHKLKTDVIYTAHGFHFYKGASIKNWLCFYPIEKLLSKWTHTLITINKEDYSLAQKKFNANNVVYVPGVGVDIDGFNSSVVDRAAVRQALGLKTDDLMLLSVGELSKRKNHEIVLQALYEIKREGISIDNIHYYICGNGSLEGHLRDKSTEYGINLHLLGFRDDIGDLCKSSDLFIFPSFQEGLPVSLMEAIACKTPVLCSKIRGNVDLINNENQLFDPTDPTSLKAVLKQFLDSYKGNDKKERIGNTVNENFDNLRYFGIVAITEKMKRIYCKVN